MLVRVVLVVVDKKVEMVVFDCAMVDGEQRRILRRAHRRRQPGTKRWPVGEPAWGTRSSQVVWSRRRASHQATRREARCLARRPGDAAASAAVAARVADTIRAALDNMATAGRRSGAVRRPGGPGRFCAVGAEGGSDVNGV